jgi:putative hydrolase of the HAD superfamily
MAIKAVLFDLFGTLLLVEDEFYIPCLRKLHKFLVRNGINVSFEDFSRVYFQVRNEIYAATEESLEEPHFRVRISQTLRRLGYNLNDYDRIVIGATDAFARKFMDYVQLDEDAIDVLQKLREEYKLGLVTNIAIPDCAWKLLEKFSLKKFFDVIVISGEVNRRKPSPEIFQKALNALGVIAPKAVFIGDMPNLDIKGAKNVGINAVLIERKPQEKETISVKPDKKLLRVWESY